jgi:hypothetical protein
MSRVGSGWGFNLGGVSLEALALPPLWLAARLRLSRVLKRRACASRLCWMRMPLLWASPCVASALKAAEHVSGWWAVPMPANFKAATRPQTHLQARPGRSPPGCRDESLVWCAGGSPGLGEQRGEGKRGQKGGRRDPARERVVSNSHAAKRLRLSTTRLTSAINPRRLSRMLHKGGVRRCF